MRSSRRGRCPARGRRRLAAAAVLLGLFAMHGLGVGHGHEVIPLAAHVSHVRHIGHADHSGHTGHVSHMGSTPRQPASLTPEAPTVLTAAASIRATAPHSHDGGLGTHALLTCLAVLPVLLLALGAALWRRMARRLPDLRDVARWCVAAPAEPPERGHRLRPSLLELCVLRT